MQTLALSNGMCVPAVDNDVFLGLPTEKSAKRQLSGSADRVIKTVGSLLNEMIFRVIEKRTAEEFQAAADEAFPTYVQLVLSTGKIVSAVVPPDVIVRLATESFSELESDIREHGLQAFGADIRDRAVFTVWTLRKIADLLQALKSAPKVTTDEQREADRDFAGNFLVHALRARFYVDCLTTSMRTRRPIYPDALTVVANGLRSTVDAYAWVRQAVDLRTPSVETDVAEMPWDEDDQELVNESMTDLEHEAH